MKRTLSFILVIVLIMGSISSADIVTTTAPDKLLTPGEILAELNIIKGSNGDFNESATLTRGELITIILRLKALDKINFTLPDVPSFSDVPKAHWAFKSVEIAKFYKITDGLGNGKFGINNKVTYQQAVMFLSRVVGMNLDYLNIKMQMRAHGVYIADAYNSKALTRNQMFILVIQSLNIRDLLDNSYFSEKLTSSGVINESVMSEYFASNLYRVMMETNSDNMNEDINDYWYILKKELSPINYEDYAFIIDYFEATEPFLNDLKVSNILQTTPIKFEADIKGYNIALNPNFSNPTGYKTRFEYDVWTYLTGNTYAEVIYEGVKCIPCSAKIGRAYDGFQASEDSEYLEVYWFYFMYDPASKKILRCLRSSYNGTWDITEREKTN